MPLLHTYQQFIWLIEHHSPGADKFDHTYAGLAIWVVASRLLRRNLRSLAPLAVVAALEAVNEILDRLTIGHWVWGDTLGDITATFFWPVLLCILLRARTIRG